MKLLQAGLGESLGMGIWFRSLDMMISLVNYGPNDERRKLHQIKSITRDAEYVALSVADFYWLQAKRNWFPLEVGHRIYYSIVKGYPE